MKRLHLTLLVCLVGGLYLPVFSYSDDKIQENGLSYSILNFYSDLDCIKEPEIKSGSESESIVTERCKVSVNNDFIYSASQIKKNDFLRFQFGSNDSDTFKLKVELVEVDEDGVINIQNSVNTDEEKKYYIRIENNILYLEVEDGLRNRIYLVSYDEELLEYYLLAYDQNLLYLSEAETADNSDALAGIPEARNSAQSSYPPSYCASLNSPYYGAYVTGTQIPFKWRAPYSGSANKYWIEIFKGATWEQSQRNRVLSYMGWTSPGAGTTLNVSGFKNDGAKYWWRVRVGNAAGWCPTAKASPRYFTNGFKQKTLTVESFGANGVYITANSSAYAGKTNYSKQTPENISIILTAPSTSGSLKFSKWLGCSSTYSRSCVVRMTSSKTVKVYYTGNPGSSCPEQTISWKRTNPWTKITYYCNAVGKRAAHGQEQAVRSYGPDSGRGVYRCENGVFKNKISFCHE